MTQDARDKTLALAAVMQAAGLASELARSGRCDEAAERTLLDATLVLDRDDCDGIFGGEAALRPGLTWLEGCLHDPGQGMSRSAELVRLALAIVQVEGHLRQRPDIQQRLRERLQSVQRQRVLHPEQTLREQSLQLGAAYVDTLGTLDFRIQVRGNAQQLQAPGMAERVRAILLAGVRAAWLWQRLGGRRWHLIFMRGRILREIRDLAKSV